MKKEIRQVAAFMASFGQDTKVNPRIPDEKTRALRRALIDEEAAELEASKDPVEALDAIADLLYVVYGAAIAYGFSEDQVERAFQTVHESNMSKLWHPAELQMIDKLENMPKEHTITKTQNRYIVKRKDGKIIKSPSYKPADIVSCLK
jgi:predicted HAD superfamily Cof-like phosphohydrolase